MEKKNILCREKLWVGMSYYNNFLYNLITFNDDLLIEFNIHKKNHVLGETIQKFLSLSVEKF